MPDDEPEKYQHGEPRTPDQIEPGTIISSDTRRSQRIPPGQVRTRKWPVLHYGYVPSVPLDKWRLEVIGLVQRPLRFTWDEFRALPRARVFADFHCVTRWSRLDNLWEGVLVEELLKRCGLRGNAKFVVLHGYDSGWTTNLPLADFLQPDCLLADTHDGQPLSADHGGPLRAIVPLLYAWKSAKWLRAIEFTEFDRLGYWERAGYHERGDPWQEQRFGSDE